MYASEATLVTTIDRPVLRAGSEMSSTMALQAGQMLVTVGIGGRRRWPGGPCQSEGGAGGDTASGAELYHRPDHPGSYRVRQADRRRRAWGADRTGTGPAGGRLAFQASVRLPYLERTGEFLVEGLVEGDCPVCLTTCRGGLCATCCHPSNFDELLDPHSSLDPNDIPTTREATALELPMEEHRAALTAYFEQWLPSWLPHLAQMIREVLSRPLADVPINYPLSWGMPAPFPETSGQVLNAWLELIPARRRGGWPAHRDGVRAGRGPGGAGRPGRVPVPAGHFVRPAPGVRALHRGEAALTTAAVRAHRGWLEVERRLGTRLYHQVGALTAVPAGALPADLAMLASAGAFGHGLSPPELAGRYRPLRLPAGLAAVW